MMYSKHHDQFPENDRVYSFTHLWMIEDVDNELNELVEKIQWYPVPKLSLRRRSI